MKKTDLFIVIGTFLVVLFNSIVYGALNSDMFINGEAHIRVDKDIRITNLKVVEQINGAYEIYNSDYSKDSTSMQISLPNNNSMIIYKATITDIGDINYILSEIIENSYSNNNIKYELVDIAEGYIIEANTTHNFKIKFTTTTNDLNNQGIITLKYNFILYEEKTWDFDYKETAQEFIVPYNGIYNIELWGASGTDRNNNLGGRGAYTSGNIELEKGIKLNIYIGEVGINWGTNRAFGAYAFNGESGGSYTCYANNGGKSAYNHYGGSATDIRLVGGNWDSDISLSSRIMVAAGGGSGGEESAGGAGGGLIGYGGSCTTGASQIEGGGPSKGAFGKGGFPVNDSNGCYNSDRYGAGSGYYGGGVNNTRGYSVSSMCSGGGGSSFISGHTGCIAITSEQDQTPKSGCTTGTTDTNCSTHYSNRIFTNTKMIDGSGYVWTNTKGKYTGMPSPNGNSTITGNTGSGYAKIKLIKIIN